jgi:plasmid maintenance system antidote protein VapI
MTPESKIILSKLKEEERSKSWLAKKLGISHSLLHLMLNGKRTFQSHYKINIAHIFNATPQEFYGQMD